MTSITRLRRRRENGKAFTLLELIVVLLVLGILAAIAVPTFNTVKRNSAERTAQATAEALARNADGIALSGGVSFDAALDEAVDELGGQWSSGWDSATDTATVTIGGYTVECLFTPGSSTTPTSVSCGDTGDAGGSSSAGSFNVSYASTVFSVSQTSQTRSPSVSGDSGPVTYSYTGTLPTGVSFDTSTGVFTGPGAWNFEATQVLTAGDQSCALTSGGGVKCWGDNSDGQLGDGTTTNSSTPVDVSGLTSGVASIAVSGWHACAVTTSGGAKCWGANWSGQLGDGTTTQRTTPVDVSGLTSGVASIAAGSGHTCAVTTSGGAMCWGSNYAGILGDGTTTDSSTPVDVSGLTSGVASISASASSHTCAVTTSGGAKCWGYNGYGQLGDGTTTNSSTPVDVSGLASGVASIIARSDRMFSYYSCVVTTSGGAKCWGRNLFGELGDGTTTGSSSPVDVSGLSSGVSSIDGGYNHVCAALVSGSAKCWGRNVYGALGDGTTTDSSTPVDVTGLASDATVIAAGGYQSCAITTTSSVQCWGYNGSGQLGDGTTTNASSPVDVSGFTGNPGWPASIDVTATDGSGSDTVTVTLTKS